MKLNISSYFLRPCHRKLVSFKLIDRQFLSFPKDKNKTIGHDGGASGKNNVEHTSGSDILPGSEGMSRKDHITAIYHQLKDQILGTNANLETNNYLNELSYLFSEEVNLYLLENSIFTFSHDISQFSKLKSPLQCIGRNYQNVEEHLVHLELLGCTFQLLENFKHIVETSSLVDKTFFVANILLVHAVKVLKFEEIDFLLSLLFNTRCESILSSHYDYSPYWEEFYGWALVNADILKPLNLSNLFFHVLFTRFYSLGEMKAIFTYLPLYCTYLNGTLPTLYDRQTIKRISLIIFHAFIANTSLLSVDLIRRSALSFLFCASRINSVAKDEYFIFHSFEYTALNRFKVLFEMCHIGNECILDGGSFSIFSKWIMQNFYNDPMMMSVSLEQLFFSYQNLIKKRHADQLHIHAHARIAFFLMLGKNFIQLGHFSECYHVLQIALSEFYHLISLWRKLDIIDDGGGGDGYTNIIVRCTYMISSLFDFVTKDPLLRNSSIHSSNPIHHTLNFSTSIPVFIPNPKLLSCNSKIFSFEKIDPKLTLKAHNFLSLVFPSSTDSTIVYSLEQGISQQKLPKRQFESLLAAKFHLVLAIFPLLINFSFNLTISVLEQLKKEDNLFYKMPSNDKPSTIANTLRSISNSSTSTTTDISMDVTSSSSDIGSSGSSSSGFGKLGRSGSTHACHFTVHAANFILGIASLPKTICSINMKNMVCEYFLSDITINDICGGDHRHGMIEMPVDGRGPSTNKPTFETQMTSPSRFRFFSLLNTLFLDDSQVSIPFLQKILKNTRIDLDFLSLYYFCRNFVFVSKINSLMTNSSFEPSISLLTSFICKILESPQLLGYDEKSLMTYPLGALTFPLEAQILEGPFSSLSSQFFLLLRNHGQYQKAFKIYSILLDRTYRRQVSGGSCLALGDFYEFRINFLNTFFRFLMERNVLASSTRVESLAPLIQSHIQEIITNSEGYDLNPEVFLNDSTFLDKTIIAEIRASIFYFSQKVTMEDISLWLTKLTCKTVGELRNIPKSSFGHQFTHLPSEACYLILHHILKPIPIVEQVPFSSEKKKTQAYTSPVLFSKSGKYVLTSQL